MTTNIEKGKTVRVLANVTVGGLAPGQAAEVDDSDQVRGYIAGGLWSLLTSEAELTAPTPQTQLLVDPVVTQSLQKVPQKDARTEAPEKTERSEHK